MQFEFGNNYFILFYLREYMLYILMAIIVYYTVCNWWPCGDNAADDDPSVV